MAYQEPSISGVLSNFTAKKSINAKKSSESSNVKFSGMCKDNDRKTIPLMVQYNNNKYNIRYILSLLVLIFF